MTALEQGRNAMETSMNDTEPPAAPDRAAANTLTYEGTAIRQRGPMLNLARRLATPGRNRALSRLCTAALGGHPDLSARV